MRFYRLHGFVGRPGYLAKYIDTNLKASSKKKAIKKAESEVKKFLKKPECEYFAPDPGDLLNKNTCHFWLSEFIWEYDLMPHQSSTPTIAPKLAHYGCKKL